MELILDMSVTLRWVDPRLTYYNLKVDNVLNTLTLNDLLDIWSPEVAFSNAKGISHTEVDRETKASILRFGAFTRGDFSYTEEVDIYDGEANPVTLNRKYSVKYACNFDLAMYPFDKQECHLEFTLSSAPRQYLVLQQLQGQGVRYEGAKNLIEYTIGNVEMVSNDTKESQYSVQMVNIRFRRRYGYYILTIYIPSIFFVSIAYLTTYFRLSNFQVRAIVSLTSMLVLTTLFSQTSSQLPRTSYFKLVDIWMFGAIGCIFCIIVTQTVIDFVYDPQEAAPVTKEPSNIITVGKVRVGRWHVSKPRAVVIMHTARFVFPVVITLFILSYVTFIAVQVMILWVIRATVLGCNKNEDLCINEIRDIECRLFEKYANQQSFDIILKEYREACHTTA
ncbi:glycine receptor subunit alpha-4-like [Penaeus japonicus]|uniref:glycine receptor subunit alpha-4-like n=1 Tax=Penaeus japonicus TaxID=27405 RepID=UPI001C717427|nr:glycine receptor subunit alpha-4-like [Penaeus japonicus]